MGTKSTNIPDLPEHRRIDKDDKEAIDKAIADGFRFVGTLCEYELKVPTNYLEVEILLGTQSDLEACMGITLTELRDSRLYADPDVPFDLVQMEYKRRVAWAFENSMILVAKLELKIIGFVSLRENRVDLIAVKRDFRRKGIGRRLMEDCVSECAASGYDTILVATQGRNHQGRKFYEGMGFDLVGIMKEFHKNG